jgi:hypothetical protein
MGRGASARSGGAKAPPLRFVILGRPERSAGRTEDPCLNVGDARGGGRWLRRRRRTCTASRDARGQAWIPDTPSFASLGRRSGMTTMREAQMRFGPILRSGRTMSLVWNPRGMPPLSCTRSCFRNNMKGCQEKVSKNSGLSLGI